MDLNSHKLIVKPIIHSRTRFIQKVCLNKNYFVGFVILQSMFLGLYFCINIVNSKYEFTVKESYIESSALKNQLELKDIEIVEIQTTAKIPKTTLSPLDRLKLKKLKTLQELK